MLLSVAVLAGLYFLPSEIAGIRVKRIDLLATLREPILANESFFSAEEIFAETNAETPPILIHEDTLQLSLEDSLAQVEANEARLRDSLYQALVIAESLDSLTKSSKVFIEDFSERHDALSHTFRAIEAERPLRVAVLGDSFIEGDIFTYHLRQSLQSQWGGHGVGWMPITSNVANFRKGIRHSFSGWNSRSSVSHPQGAYYFGETTFHPTAELATISYSVENGSALAGDLLATLYYQSSMGFTLITHDQEGSDTLQLAETLGIDARQIPFSGSTLRLEFKEAQGVVCYGVSFEEVPASGGAFVDNFSLRGSAGTSLTRLDASLAGAMDQLRHHQLIILQYGLNVMQKDRLNYSSYANQMLWVIARLRELFPTSDILIMGVSDRGENVAGEVQTMHAALALREAIKGVAMRAGVAYWDTYKAMQCGGGIKQFVTEGKAAKDYTHLSFAGGRFIANKFMEALLAEYTIYQRALEQ